VTVCIQEDVFNIEKIISLVRKNNSSIGAIVSFIGFVREFDNSKKTKKLLQMDLEHYPGMTEKALNEIELNAKSKWQLEDVYIIHRIGKLKPTEPIVAVVVASEHRKNAFEACEFIIDFLKTEAPFWKKEISDQQIETWVEGRDEDYKKRDAWNVDK
tara:strand:- start:109 stop:579 length:471 start_codon:yes stop_codon:yes gene_type:complete